MAQVDDKSNILWRIFHQMHHSAERLDTYGAFYFSPYDMIGFYITWYSVFLFYFRSCAAISYYFSFGI
jgi:sterol desaturase/sphingolipid hydroxylase (fatty acid hydroxylase superfamily)